MEVELRTLNTTEKLDFLLLFREEVKGQRVLLSLQSRIQTSTEVMTSGNEKQNYNMENSPSFKSLLMLHIEQNLLGEIESGNINFMC